MATEYSIQKMVSDGTLSTIALGIQYLQRNDIYIRIAGEETPQSGAPSGYTWSFVDNTTIKILPVVPNGVEVVVYRRTDVDVMYNIYSQNAQFDESTIDENNQQLLYIAQEYYEQGIPAQLIDSIEYVREDTTTIYYRLKLSDGKYTAEFPIPKGGTAGFAALRRSYAEAGYDLIGTFRLGVTLNTATDVILDEPTGIVYSWGGTLPAVVPAGSTPASTGGVAAGAWRPKADETLRAQLAAPTGSKSVGFKQSAINYTGPIARTVEGKLFDVVSVKDFGAVGDGVTDDSAAFLKAILYVLHIDVGGAAYPNKVFGKTILVPAGTYEIKSKVAASLSYSMAVSLEGESELTTFISVNNPNGFLDLTMTSRAASLTVKNITLLAKYGTASSQPGVGRDDLPVTLADVHDIPSGVGIKMTFPAGILTAKTKSLKMTDVIMTGWNRTRGDFFSEGVSLIGGRNPTLERVVIEGKYGYLLTGKPDALYSAGTAFKMVDSYSPTLEDCYCNHYVRGFDLTSSSADPAFSSSEGGNLVRSAFDAMYGIRVAMPSIGGEPGFNIINCHLNYTRIGIDFQGKNQVIIDGCLFYCEADVPGTVARDIFLKGTQKSVVVNNIFAKTNVEGRYCITFSKWRSQPVASCVVNNNMYWAGGTVIFRCYNISGVGAASNITIGDGECHEDVTNLFVANGEYAAINPMRIYSDASPEASIWAPLGSLCVVRPTGAMYKKGGSASTSSGWTLIP